LRAVGDSCGQVNAGLCRQRNKIPFDHPNFLPPEKNVWKLYYVRGKEIPAKSAYLTFLILSIARSNKPFFMPSFPSHIKSKLPKTGTTIFTVMSALAQEHGAINLSQGFPRFFM
jgi:hypothetical protein